MRAAARCAHPGAAVRPSALVWIDAREAIVVRWVDGRAAVERVGSDVPPRRRSTGHIRHDPAVRHGGGGPAEAGEPRRLEHLTRYIEHVARTLPPDEDLIVIGPGTIRLQLERHVRDRDRTHRLQRSITCRAAPRLSDRQLVERLRLFGAS